MNTLTKWEELERRLQESGLDEFHGKTGWVRCEPYQYPTTLGTDQVWVWIKTDQGTSTVTALPGDSLEDFWTRFLKEIEPLREVSRFSRNRLDQPRTVDYASPPEEGAIGTHCLEVVAACQGRSLIDPILYWNPPGFAYLEKFRLLAESKGMKGAKVGLRARLVR